MSVAGEALGRKKDFWKFRQGLGGKGAAGKTSVNGKKGMGKGWKGQDRPLLEWEEISQPPQS